MYCWSEGIFTVRIGTSILGKSTAVHVTVSSILRNYKIKSWVSISDLYKARMERDNITISIGREKKSVSRLNLFPRYFRNISCGLSVNSHTEKRLSRIFAAQLF